MEQTFYRGKREIVLHRRNYLLIISKWYSDNKEMVSYLMQEIDPDEDGFHPTNNLYVYWEYGDLYNIGDVLKLRTEMGKDKNAVFTKKEVSDFIEYLQDRDLLQKFTTGKKEKPK